MSERAHECTLPHLGNTLGGIAGLRVQSPSPTARLRALLEPPLDISVNARTLDGEVPTANGSVEGLEVGLVKKGAVVAGNRHPPAGQIGDCEVGVKLLVPLLLGRLVAWMHQLDRLPLWRRRRRDVDIDDAGGNLRWQRRQGGEYASGRLGLGAVQAFDAEVADEAADGTEVAHTMLGEALGVDVHGLAQLGSKLAAQTAMERISAVHAAVHDFNDGDGLHPAELFGGAAVVCHGDGWGW